MKKFLFWVILVHLLFSKSVCAEHLITYNSLGRENIEGIENSRRMVKTAEEINCLRNIIEELETRIQKEQKKFSKILKDEITYARERHNRQLTELQDELREAILERQQLEKQIDALNKQNQTASFELFNLRKTNQKLNDKTAHLVNKIEELKIERQKDQTNFSLQLKGENTAIQERYNQRLKEIQNKLEKAISQQQQLHQQMQELAAKTKEERLEVEEKRLKDEAEEAALNRWEQKLK